MKNPIKAVVTGAVLVGVIGVFSCKLPTPPLNRVVGGDSGAPTSEENDQGNVGGRVDTCIKGWVGYDSCRNFVLSEKPPKRNPKGKNPKGKKDGVLWKLNRIPTTGQSGYRRAEVDGYYYEGSSPQELCGRRGLMFFVETLVYKDI